jgi:hypothetical protein
MWASPAVVRTPRLERRDLGNSRPRLGGPSKHSDAAPAIVHDGARAGADELLPRGMGGQREHRAGRQNGCVAEWWSILFVRSMDRPSCSKGSNLSTHDKVPPCPSAAHTFFRPEADARFTYLNHGWPPAKPPHLRDCRRPSVCSLLFSNGLGHQHSMRSRSRVVQ